MEETKLGTQSINRSLQLMDAIGAAGPQGARLSHLAKTVDIHVATTHRILSALVAHNMIAFDPVSKRYRLGYRLFDLANRARYLIVCQYFRTAMEEIAAKTEDSVFLMVPAGLDAICADIIFGAFPVRASSLQVGDRRPQGIGASSLAMLASRPEEEAEQIIRANETRYPRYQNLTFTDVSRMVQQARQRGHAEFTREVEVKYTAVGLAVSNDNGEPVAGLGVSAVNTRMSAARRKEIVTVMRAEIDRIPPFAKQEVQVS
jgi:DNA-binding IclR family transcriptional regulator